MLKREVWQVKGDVKGQAMDVFLWPPYSGTNITESFLKNLQRDLKVSLVVSLGTCFNLLCIWSFTFSAYLFSKEECVYCTILCVCMRACGEKCI
jgi:hypothetical protein